MSVGVRDVFPVILLQSLCKQQWMTSYFDILLFFLIQAKLCLASRCWRRLRWMVRIISIAIGSVLRLTWPALPFGRSRTRHSIWSICWLSKVLHTTADKFRTKFNFKIYRNKNYDGLYWNDLHSRQGSRWFGGSKMNFFIASQQQ